MLYARRNIRLLDSLHHRHDQFRDQIRVLTHIFKISSTERAPLDIDSRGENHVFASSSCLLAQHSALLTRKLAVPGRCHRAVTREIAYKIICRTCISPLIVRKFRTHAHRTVREKERRYGKPLHPLGAEQPRAVDHSDLFFQCQLF